MLRLLFFSAAILVVFVVFFSLISSWMIFPFHFLLDLLWLYAFLLLLLSICLNADMDVNRKRRWIYAVWFVWMCENLPTIPLVHSYGHTVNRTSNVWIRNYVRVKEKQKNGQIFQVWLCFFSPLSLYVCSLLLERHRTISRKRSLNDLHNMLFR